METATEVGGDYYDFYEDANGELTVLIGDATGHGLNAGMVVTATKSLFNSHAANPNIIDTFYKMSDSLKQMNFRLLSMCLMLLKLKDGKLKISSAGMPPAFIYRAEEQIVDEMIIKGMPLGTKKDFPYELRETTLEPGDTILLMSDGFPELINKEKKLFGYDTAKSKFEEIAEKEPEAIITHLLKCSKEWMGEKAPDDDVTFVVIKVNK
jgi:serine phosphatase RsbU (regulator of sigma subunit)